MRGVELDGMVASLLDRVVHGGERHELPDLPPVVGGTWGDVDLDEVWGPLAVQGPELTWEAAPKSGSGVRFRELWSPFDRLRNQSARLKLVDGRQVAAELGSRNRWGSRPGLGEGPTCSFHLWEVEGHLPRRWIGTLHGGGFRRGNLTIRRPGRFSSKHLRLEGNYTWFLLGHHDDEPMSVVVDGGKSSTLDRNALGIDFIALQLVLGAPLRLDNLIALDDPGNVVGWYALLEGSLARSLRRFQAPRV